MLYNLYLYPGKNVAGFRNFHTCIPYRKKDLETVWNAYPRELDYTCRNKFRSREDVNQYFFRYWRLMLGDFIPSRPNSRYLTLGEDSTQSIAAALNGDNYKVVCVNDDPMSCDMEQQQKEMWEIFQKKFPVPCAYENTVGAAHNTGGNEPI